MSAIPNLLGITSELELAKEEERLSKIRAMRLWDEHILDSFTPGSVESLTNIHHYLFQDIYEWAGQLRTVDIAKDGFRFCSWKYLPQELHHIDSTFPVDSFQNIVNKYAELNVAHPFREGNGRALRLWLDLVIDKKLGKQILWGNIERGEYMDAMERSHVRTGELYLLLSHNLVESDGVTRDMFAHVVNISYSYEQQTCYDAKTL